MNNIVHLKMPISFGIVYNHEVIDLSPLTNINSTLVGSQGVRRDSSGIIQIDLNLYLRDLNLNQIEKIKNIFQHEFDSRVF